MNLRGKTRQVRKDKESSMETPSESYTPNEDFTISTLSKGERRLYFRGVLISYHLAFVMLDKHVGNSDFLYKLINKYGFNDKYTDTDIRYRLHFNEIYKLKQEGDEHAAAFFRELPEVVTLSRYEHHAALYLGNLRNDVKDERVIFGWHLCQITNDPKSGYVETAFTKARNVGDDNNYTQAELIERYLKNFVSQNSPRSTIETFVITTKR